MKRERLNDVANVFNCFLHFYLECEHFNQHFEKYLQLNKFQHVVVQ